MGIATVTGWGASQMVYSSGSNGIVIGINNGQPSDVLKKLEDVRLLGHEECDSILEEYETRANGKAKLRRSNICGNSPTGDSCVGDSGSGLTAWNEDIQAYELIGVVSFGIGCNSSFESKKGPRLSKYYELHIADTKLPGVYTRV